MKFKTISILLLALLFTTGLNAQQTITNEEHKKVVTNIDGNLFSVKFLETDGTVAQEGQYWEEDNLLKPHGTWTLYSAGEVVTTSTFNKGERLSVETIVNGKVIKADKQALTIKKLEQEINQLEKRLADLKKN
ncbi:MAG: hypothetical protein CL670_04725 [Balneola sp.]|jgi:hypothetical protein|nr:hypothetical protein [Balneola sp.]MBE78435.1 hypothetical protein [Balneola sp.]|tara:strand:- start:2930 stop:3328 length:399 start_codon:yes stop_codon:yes gene_type:complete